MKRFIRPVITLEESDNLYFKKKNLISKKSIMCIIMIITIALFIWASYLFGNQPVNQNPIPELRTERIYEIHNYQNMIGIWCIDGYKWILTSAGAMQAYRVDGKGNSVPARCDE